MLMRADRSQAPAPRAGQGAHSLALTRLSRHYGPVRAVDEVSLDIPGGEFLTLLGPSGSGKTTLLMMIAGFVAPSAGRIAVDGRDVTAVPPEKRNFGMVFQGYALFPHMTVAENIAYPLRVRGVSRAEIATKVAGAIARVRLDGFDDRYPKQLSGGQQQRVAVARALVFDPDIVLFDEPLGALDRQLRAEMQLELKTLHRDLGATFILVTHDQDEALSMADRVAVMNRGRLVQAGAPDELYEQPRTRFVAEFLGKSNCIAGRMAGRDGELIRLETGGAAVAHRGTVTPPQGRGVLLALRPEKVRVAAQEPREMANRVPGRILDIAYLGATRQVVVGTEAFGPVTATGFAWEAAPDLGLGAAAWVGWAPEATVLIEDEADDRSA
ncbi:ABC transporter ATP-binding protein [Inquilinus sp.]|jgi:putative spermidine/putrescine transport system ATP-binding protein|uniref:ABC transporter ATP-binding protein n=1 Tax=Inquilinus sp. TaxID=1932117 RepID=UPI0037831AD4